MSLVLLMGGRQSGKTTACRRIVETARGCGLCVGGILSPAIHEQGRCVGYEVVDVAGGRSTQLAGIDVPGVERAGRFTFLPEGLELGRAALARACGSPCSLIVVDEVGPLEFGGGGWAAHLDKLAARDGVTLFTVRRSLIRDAARRWNVSPDAILDVDANPDAAIAAAVQRLRPTPSVPEA